MSQPISAWTIVAILDDDLVVVERAIGGMRRRQLPLSDLAVGPARGHGALRLTCSTCADWPATQRLANQLRRIVGVRMVSVHPAGDCIVREQVLVRVRAIPSRLGELLDTLALYQATVVEEPFGALVVQVSGAAPFLASCLRALEPFGVLDVARGGSAVLAPGDASAGDVMPASRAATGAAYLTPDTIIALSPETR
jgi:acetolactate synthase-1/3 small subunit